MPGADRFLVIAAAALLTCGLPLWGCAEKGEPGETTVEPADAASESSEVATSGTSLSGYSNELGPGFRDATRDSVRRRFGEPDSIEFKTLPNQHVTGVEDTIFTMWYRDLIVTVHRPGRGHDMLSSATVSSNRLLRLPLVGVSSMAVRKAFGAPVWQSDSSITYDCIGCMAVEDPVEFVLAGNRVIRVRLSYYID